jgi:FkbM family methyltransferase
MFELNCGIKEKRMLNFGISPYPEGSTHPYGYEPEIINAIEHFLEPGDVFIDVGASIGFHSCLASKMVGEDGLVLAFEPHLESFAVLAHHVHVANHLNNVAMFKLALWKEDCPAMPLWSLNELGYSSLHHYLDGTRSEAVEGVALDEFISENEHPRAIKIDVEGTEGEVLLGARNILQRGVDCVILELNYNIFEKTNRSDMVIRQFMAAMGYDMFLINICDNDGRGKFLDPIKVENDVTITLQGGHHINVMFSTMEKVAKRWGSKTSNS